MANFILNDAVVTKKIIDLLVEFLRNNAKRNKMYEHTHVSDRFNLEQVRIPAIIVKNVSNTQRRIHYDDFIDDITGKFELVPISGDNSLVGNNLIRTNLPNSLDYDPRWPLDPTIGYPTGIDITQAVYTSQTGGSFNSGVTTGMIITLPPPEEFDPSSFVYALEAPRLDGTANPITTFSRTVNSTGLLFEGYANENYSQTASGTSLSVTLNYSSVLPLTALSSGINAVYSGNNTGSGMFPYTGTGINQAGWYQSGNALYWSNGSYADFSGASAAGQVPMSGQTYWVDYSYSGPDVHTIAVALSADQSQFYLIYSGNSILTSSKTVIQPVELSQYIVNASGLVPGLTGTVMKLNDVLYAGDQYQALTFPTEQLTYAVYGGLYEMTVNFECYANSTLEAQELGDLVEKFLVERKKAPYDANAFNLTAWSQGGQGEEEYINDHIFSTSVSVDGFRFWQEYRGLDIITGVSGIAIPTGFYNNSGTYVPPGVMTNLTWTNPDQPNQANLR